MAEDEVWWEARPRGRGPTVLVAHRSSICLGPGLEARLFVLSYLHSRERIVAYDLFEDGAPVVIRERVAA